MFVYVIHTYFLPSLTISQQVRCKSMSMGELLHFTPSFLGRLLSMDHLVWFLQKRKCVVYIGHDRCVLLVIAREARILSVREITHHVPLVLNLGENPLRHGMHPLGTFYHLV